MHDGVPHREAVQDAQHGEHGRADSVEEDSVDRQLGKYQAGRDQVVHVLLALLHLHAGHVVEGSSLGEHIGQQEYNVDLSRLSSCSRYLHCSQNVYHTLFNSISQIDRGSEMSEKELSHIFDRPTCEAAVCSYVAMHL